MKNYIYTFIGCDKHEIILYYSRFLLKLGKKVLVMDFSETKCLTYSVPNPNNLDIVDYRGVMFTNARERIVDIKDYDFVLIDGGFNPRKEILELSNYDVFVTDLQLHHIFPLKKFLENYTIPDDKKKCLVIKDCLSNKVKAAFVVKELGLKLNEEELFTLFFDETDYGNKLLCQHNYKFKFKGSSDVKALLMALASNEQFTKKELIKAYKKAEGGL